VAAGAATTLRGLESCVLAATTRPEPTIETPAKTSTGVNVILRLFNLLIQIPIQTPIDVHRKSNQISLTFHGVACEQPCRKLATL